MLYTERSIGAGEREGAREKGAGKPAALAFVLSGRLAVLSRAHPSLILAKVNPIPPQYQYQYQSSCSAEYWFSVLVTCFREARCCAWSLS